jgi:hypothetical protein
LLGYGDGVADAPAFLRGATTVGEAVDAIHRPWAQLPDTATARTIIASSGHPRASRFVAS